MIVTSRRFPRDLRRTRPPWLWRHVSPRAILRRTWRVAHNASREVRACFFIFFSAYQFDHSRTAKCVFFGWSVTPACKRMYAFFASVIRERDWVSGVPKVRTVVLIYKFWSCEWVFCIRQVYMCHWCRSCFRKSLSVRIFWQIRVFGPCDWQRVQQETSRSIEGLK